MRKHPIQVVSLLDDSGCPTLRFLVNHNKAFRKISGSFDQAFTESKFNTMMFYVMALCGTKLSHMAHYNYRKMFWLEEFCSFEGESETNFVWMEDCGLFAVGISDYLESKTFQYLNYQTANQRELFVRDIKDACDILVKCPFKRAILKHSIPDFVVDWFVEEHEVNPRHFLWPEL